MPKSILSSRLVDVVDSCLREANSVGSIKHNGMVGKIREIFLTDLILPLLPDGFYAGTGKIIDRVGELSAETDIIIYNKSRFSPLLFDEKTGIFPIDCVYYAIEVKSTVTLKEVRDAIKKGESIRSLNGPPIHHVLFGFRTNLKKEKEKALLRIQESQKEYEFPPVNIYCVVDAGYCYYEKEWKVFVSTDRRAEVIGLLIGIVNTLVKTGIRSPDFNPGNYLAWWE
ncbi:DUF6602 domain-containing protein [Nitrosomonas sp. Is35]|uniref:DUF6602 domain-containing protein n=1 Tax=Nitrosomonas sp. Is35 TaxID=3080534 RepID=UPI00294AFB5A|nr:DUF6602 domain-containing protein [Nitrosomonas sp. Is35]MDV6348195.1 DUF6602 domain-containing protein [Nitrosomonas sp. Is35]